MALGLPSVLESLTTVQGVPCWRRFNMTLEPILVSLLESPIEELGASTTSFTRWVGGKQRQICSLAISQRGIREAKAQETNDSVHAIYLLQKSPGTSRA